MTTPNDPLTTLGSALNRYTTMQNAARAAGRDLTPPDDTSPTVEESPQEEGDTGGLSAHVNPA